MRESPVLTRRRVVLGVSAGGAALALLSACSRLTAAPTPVPTATKPAATPAPSATHTASAAATRPTAGATPSSAATPVAATTPITSTAATRPAASAITPTVAAQTRNVGKAAITLAYWRPIKGKGEETGTNQITEAYAKAHSNVAFKTEFIPQDNLPQKLQGGLATGTGPDIMALDTQWPVVYAALGVLADPPNDLQGFLKEKTYPLVQTAISHKGKFVAVPLDSSDLVLAYNEKLMQEAGLKTDRAPADWTELMQWAEKATKRDGAGKLTQSGLWTDWSEWDWTAWLAAAGGQWWHTLEGVDYLEPPFVDAMQLYQDAIYKHKVFDVGTLPDAFTQGKAAMILAGPWTVTGMKQDAPNLKWGSWLVPPMKAGGASGTTLGGWHLGANAKSKNAETIWDFVNFHLTTENRVLWLKLTARTPPYKDLADDAIFKGDPNVETMVKQMSFNEGHGKPSSPAYLDVRDNITQVIDRVIKQHEDIRKVLGEEKAKIDKVFVEKSKS
ncbi:MAG TPA: extracellular solute-binding protein [Chloroflexota bacterium]